MTVQGWEAQYAAVQCIRNFSSMARFCCGNPSNQEPLSTMESDSSVTNLFCVCEHWCFAARSKFNIQDTKIKKVGLDKKLIKFHICGFYLSWKNNQEEWKAYESLPPALAGKQQQTAVSVWRRGPGISQKSSEILRGGGERKLVKPCLLLKKPFHHITFSHKSQNQGYSKTFVAILICLW